MEQRRWINSGVIEDLDRRQVELIRHVLAHIQFYYRHLHGTRDCYRHPLSLARLMKLCHRNSHAVTTALRYLANTVPVGATGPPPITYDRIQATRNKSHRPYRIFLRKSMSEYT